MPPKKRSLDSDGEAEKKRRKRKGEAANGSDTIDGIDDDEDTPIVLEGSMLNGEVLFCGATNWDLVGRSQVPKGVKNLGGRNLWGPHRIAALKGVQIRTVASGCTACHSFAITTEGKVYSWGRNDKAQLGHGDTVRRDNPTLMDSLVDFNIVDVACGKNHTLLLTDRGRCFAVGDNKMGQLGLGHQSPVVPSPTRIQYKGPAIRRIACGGEFSMIIDVRGNLYSFGCPEFGQLGHNSDGKYFVTSSKLAYNCELKPRPIKVFIEKTRDNQILPLNDVEVWDVACGINHSILLDRKKRAFTWGFGGYGRLGHAQPKDEWVPKLLKFFEGPNRGASQIACGSTYTMAVSEIGQLYLWGKYKPTGEAAMYPKPIQDLSGWQLRSIGCCNRSIVVAADNSLVSWGPSPTYGELGYGENKPRSSPHPQEVKLLAGIYIHKVACGYGHTLMIARNESEEEQALLEQLPELAAT